MSALLDADVLLDLTLARPEHFAAAAQILDAAEAGKFEAFAAFHSVANVYYLTRKQGKAPRAFIRDLCGFVSVRGADEAGIVSALGFPMADFEDALVALVALESRCSVIVTRNAADFQRSPVPAVSPSEFVAQSFSDQPGDYA